MNAHKQLDTSRLLARRDVGAAPFVSEPRDFMPAQVAQSFDAMRDRDRFLPSRTRHDLSVSDESVYDTLGAGELGTMERAVRDHYDLYDGGASRHSFGGTVAAPSGGTLATTQGAVAVTRYGDAELSVARPTVRYAKTMSRDAEVKAPASRQYVYEQTQRAGDRVERAVHCVPQCNKTEVSLSPRAEAALANLRAMRGCATRVVARHIHTSTPAPNKSLDGAYVSPGLVSHARSDDATVVSDRPERSTTVRAPLCDAASARQADWHLEHRADRERVREAAKFGEMHTVRQAERIENDRETRVVCHEAPQFGAMHTVRQAERIDNDRETRITCHEAPQFGAMHTVRQAERIENDRETRVVRHEAPQFGAMHTVRQAERIDNDRGTRITCHEAPQFGAMHTVRQAERIDNDRETRVVCHEAPQFGEMHTVRQAERIDNDRETRGVVHGAVDVGAFETTRLERPRLPKLIDRTCIAHWPSRPTELTVQHSRAEPTLLAPRNERAGGPEQRGLFGHAPTKRLLGVRLESGNASATSVALGNLGAVATRGDLVPRDVDFSTAVSSHLAPSQHQQYRAPNKEMSSATTRNDIDAPACVNISARPRGPECGRETLRLEPHHAAVGIAPPLAHGVRARGRQEYDARAGTERC